MSAEPESPKVTSASDEKAQLECEKLRAETKVILRPFYKTAAFYVATSPVILALLGLYFTQQSGWFDVQRTRVSNEKTLLEAQTERLKMERTTLEAKAQEQQAAFAKAVGEIQTLKERESFLTNHLVRLERERAELLSAKALLEDETKRLAGSDVKAKEFLEQLKSLQVTREQQAALIRWANEVLWEGWGIALKDKTTYARFQDFGMHVYDVRIASRSSFPEWLVEPDPTPTPKQETNKASDEEMRRELVRLWREASKKTDEDRIREAREKFVLLGGETFDNINTNREPQR